MPSYNPGDRVTPNRSNVPAYGPTATDYSSLSRSKQQHKAILSIPHPSNVTICHTKQCQICTWYASLAQIPVNGGKNMTRKEKPNNRLKINFRSSKTMNAVDHEKQNVQGTRVTENVFFFSIVDTKSITSPRGHAGGLPLYFS